MGKKTIEFEGISYNIEISHDEWPFDLRKDCDNLGIMACSHSRYNLGDEQITSGVKADAEDKCYEKYGKLTTEGVFEFLAESYGAVAWLPLSLLDHSGLKMYAGVSQGWDIGPVGIIYTTKEQMKKIGYHNPTNERIKEILEEEVKLYSYGLEGEVYRFNIEWEDKDGESQEDSCGSFYGPAKTSGMAEAIASVIGLYDRTTKTPYSLKKGDAEEIMKDLQRCDFWLD